jgi:hypothetical protein
MALLTGECVASPSAAAPQLVLAVLKVVLLKIHSSLFGDGRLVAPVVG